MADAPETPASPRPNRKLPALLAALGFALALLGYLLVVWNAEPTRVNVAYVGDGEGYSVGHILDAAVFVIPLGIALVGALTGWWAGIVAIRRSRRISHDGG